MTDSEKWVLVTNLIGAGGGGIIAAVIVLWGDFLKNNPQISLNAYNLLQRLKSRDGGYDVRADTDGIQLGRAVFIRPSFNTPHLGDVENGANFGWHALPNWGPVSEGTLRSFLAVDSLSYHDFVRIKVAIRELVSKGLLIKTENPKSKNLNGGINYLTCYEYVLDPFPKYRLSLWDFLQINGF